MIVGSLACGGQVAGTGDESAAGVRVSTSSTSTSSGSPPGATSPAITAGVGSSVGTLSTQATTVAFGSTGAPGSGSTSVPTGSTSALAPVVLASSVPGTDIEFDGTDEAPAVFVTSGGGVVRISCNGASCDTGSSNVIVAGGVIGNTTSGLAVDGYGTLYVAAGFNGLDDTIYKVAAAASCAPPCTATAFASGFKNLRSMDTAPQLLYAADFGAGRVIQIPLDDPSSASVFASVPGVFGLWARALGDVFVTSNSGCNGFACGVGDGTAKHLGSAGAVDWSASAGPYPEGISGTACNLYIATNTYIYSMPIFAGGMSQFSTAPTFSHGVDVGGGSLYATESGPAGDVWQVPVPACPILPCSCVPPK